MTDESNIPIEEFPFDPDGENIDPAHSFPEPSDIVFHDERGTLFVVGDEGAIAEINAKGKVLHFKELGIENLEGITWAVSTGMLYVAVEGKEAILEIDQDTFDVTRTFEIKREFAGVKVLKKGNNGVESIVFVPDGEHKHGGTFFVANQAKEHGDDEDASALLELSVPLEGAKSKAKIVAYYPQRTLDLAALCYDPARDVLIAASDQEDRCLEFTRDGLPVRSYALPGEDQEGIAVDADGNLYVAQDSGGIIKYRAKG